MPDGMDLLLGNGSDELIQMLALGGERPGAVLLGVEPSFVMFRMVATFTGMRYVGVPLACRFRPGSAAMLSCSARAPARAYVHRVPEQSDRQSVRRGCRSALRSKPRRVWSWSTRPTMRSLAAAFCPSSRAIPICW